MTTSTYAIHETFRRAVVRATLAPSVHNTQPWRFAADGGPRISLHADVERRLAAAVALHSQPLELPWLREVLRTQLSDACSA